MKELDIYYENLIKKIENLINNDVFEGSDDEELVVMVGELERIHDELVDKKSAIEILEEIDDILSVLSSLSALDIDEEVNVLKFILGVQIAINNIITEGNADSILEGTSEFNQKHKLQEYTGFSYNFFADNNTCEEKAVSFSYENYESFSSFVDSINDKYILLSIMDNMLEIDVITGKWFILIKEEFNVDNIDELLSYVKLRYVSEGKHYHSLNHVTREPLNYAQYISSSYSVNYRQYQDIVDVLSEYNEKNDILDKFMRIYHVIENFMYRKPICELMGNTTFSIRDFKRLYDKVSVNEIKAIQELFDSILEEDFVTTSGAVVKLKTELCTQFNDYYNNNIATIFSDGQLNLFVTSVAVGKKYHNILDGNVSEQKMKENFYKIVYGIRCSIVHNKEIEKHINHHNLSTQMKDFLDNCLLLALEKIIYHLLYTTSNAIRYSDNKIYLYQ